MAQPANVLGVFKDPDFTYNTVDLSTFVRQVTLSVTTPENEINASQSGSWVGKKPGRSSYQLTVEFYQSFYTSEVDATIGAAALAQTSAAWELVPTADAASGTNPKYSGTAWISDYEPVSGTVDDVLMAPVTFVGDGDLTRATS